MQTYTMDHRVYAKTVLIASRKCVAANLSKPTCQFKAAERIAVCAWTVTVLTTQQKWKGM